MVRVCEESPSCQNLRYELEAGMLEVFVKSYKSMWAVEKEKSGCSLYCLLEASWISQAARFVGVMRKRYTSCKLW